MTRADPAASSVWASLAAGSTPNACWWRLAMPSRRGTPPCVGRSRSGNGWEAPCRRPEECSAASKVWGRATWEFIHDAQLAAIMVRGQEILVRVALPACPGFHFENSLPETPGLNRVLAFICLIPLEAGRPRTLQALHYLKPGSGSNRDPDSTAVFCLISALAHHGLTPQMPHAADVALPSHAQVSKVDGVLFGSYPEASFHADVDLI
jgi:hypothetical protein